MNMFRREKLTHNQILEREAGLGAYRPEAARTVGVGVVSLLNETSIEPTESTEPTDVTETSDNSDDAEIKERIRELELMTVDELLKDGLDDMARGEDDEDEDDVFYMTRAAAVNGRAVALLLKQLIQEKQQDV
jgi:hypothetical protein